MRKIPVLEIVFAVLGALALILFFANCGGGGGDTKPPAPTAKITSIYVVGNSYSSIAGAWPSPLSGLLGNVPVYNAAQPSASLDDLVTPPRPGLLAQLGSLPKSKLGALLVIWIFPAFDADPAHVISVYTQGIDKAHALGFKTVLMPNAPDATKTPLVKSTRTPAELVAMHNQIQSFNSQYSTMLGTFRTRHPDMKIRGLDMFNKWDGSGTGPDGFHPNATTSALFAQWFKDATK